MFSTEEKERYSRQILLDSFGEEGQAKLQQAAVLVVGAGGLGCPALTYLVAAGIGHVGIMDHDTIERSNLHRQTLYSTADIGQKKVKVAAARLLSLNPNVRISEYGFLLSASNALDVFATYDIVIDGTDNLAARYIINDACSLLQKPWVYGSVYKYEGQVALFNFSMNNNNRSADYRCLFPEPPPASSLATCNEVGVLGVVPGLIGLLQATECIKYLKNERVTANTKLITYDALNASIETYELARNTHADEKRPLTEAAFRQMNYIEYCERRTYVPCEIDSAQLEALLANQQLEIIDLRESAEVTTLKGLESRNLPSSLISIDQIKSSESNTIVFICQRGIRSKVLIEKLNSENVKGIFYSLKDGAEGWNRFIQAYHVEMGTINSVI